MEANSFSSRDVNADVVVLGGALAGASAALLLRRRSPHLRILIIEKSPCFQRRVGEATVEVSAFFLGRVLGLTQHLNESHLVKQGMRFWFSTPETESLADASEIGGRYLVRLPSYQVDRSTLDEEALRRAVDAGVSLVRPARVRSVELQEGGVQKISFTEGSEAREVTARWVIDATGVSAFLSRQEGWYQSNEAHPTAAIWARWRGVKDWDGRELAERHPKWAAACHGIRGTATNHLVGDGWWAWMIPLKGGDTSVGVVWDQRHLRWPVRDSKSAFPAQSDGSREALGDQLKAFLIQHPVGRELLEDATPIEGDAHRRTRLAYSSRRYAGDGFVLVGDAAAFLDPLYSPGMDWLSYTVTRAVDLIAHSLDGQSAAAKIQSYQNDFTRCYQRWFTAIYLNKYDYLGDFELMRTAFRLDLALYYLGVVSQPFLRGADSLGQPSFTTPPSTPVYHLIRLYTRRLASMGRERRKRGCFGTRNRGERFLLSGFAFDAASGFSVVKALASWGMLELREGWRTWGRKEEVRVPHGGSIDSNLASSSAPTTEPQAVASRAAAGDGVLR